MASKTALQRERLKYKPVLPKILSDLSRVCFSEGQKKSLKDEKLKEIFPHLTSLSVFEVTRGKGAEKKLKIGVLFSGGPAPGGHNVITSLYDTGAEIIGFLNGAGGLIEDRFKKIENVDAFRNQGGFDLIGTGRTKIESSEQLNRSLETCQKHGLDGLVIIGGDDSNTNSAVLAEYFLGHSCSTKVVGVPKTIDADLRSEEIELSFGFDTATKCYSELIGNIEKDAISTKKYYHFIKLMGRSASHIALECALATHPNLCLIGEERRSLNEILDEIVNLIIKRAEKGKNYGVILIPEGMIEFVPELSDVLSNADVPKDPHGNVELSKIETEKFLLDFVKKELKKRNFNGKFNAQTHFFGYEGRSCMPTNFDANYCYTLGKIAYLAIRDGLTGVICAVKNLSKSVDQWVLKAAPIVSMIHLEKRNETTMPVIQKYLVDLNKSPYLKYVQKKQEWMFEDDFRYVGPIQYFGPSEITDQAPFCLSE